MKLFTIFAGDNKHKGVLSIDFDDSEDVYDDSGTELIKLMDKWFDTEYLHDFFSKHESDLNNNYYNEHITITQAVKLARNEAYELFNKLSNLAGNQSIGDGETLSTIFQPLNDEDYSTSDLQQHKYKIKSKLKCLRLYAIRISPETFVVTGGAIKLVDSMKKRKHLRKQIDQLERARDFLINEGILDQDDLNSYEL